ncbi:MAG: prephenate dehydrogenase [Acholeplasmatales bacterium]|nr:MAG: prephenate dehydrogenase [Acholeplasmatales bacterium]
MNVYIVGLGLIGASYAAGLRAAGHTIDGFDINADTLQKAKTANLIDTGRLEGMRHAEILILALYPNDIPAFLQTHRHLIPETALITDVAGVKKPLETALHKQGITRGRYVSHHPMAGKAKQGFDAHDGTLFKGANCILIAQDGAESSQLDTLQTVLADLGFGRFITVDAARHDRLIAFTSQLTHALAVALMHADSDPLTPQATGDSFRDLTRIAEINAPMWCELFLANQHALTEEIERFQTVLDRLKQHIQDEDATALTAMFETSTTKRQSFNRLTRKV